jgi:two-component system, cell cycle sensor histidine kinase and response regulator CckA
MDKDSLARLRRQIDMVLESETEEASANLRQGIADTLWQVGRSLLPPSVHADDLERALRAIEDTWVEGSEPSASLPGTPEQQERLAALCSDMRAIQGLALSIANGDLSPSLKVKGIVAGSFKTLQSNLRHVTWQTGVIAQGDFHQRVDFMGELSESFNSMVSSLSKAQDQVRRHTRELLELNANLTAEICEREQAEAALRESERRYRTLFENNHTVMLLIDPETAEVVDANPRACSFYGYAYEDLLKLKITDINTLTAEQVNEEMKRARSERRTCFNFRHRLANGEIRDVEVYSGPIGMGGRQLLFSVIHDETERKRTAQRLRDSEMRYRTIFETTGTAMLIVEEDTSISLANSEFAKLSGYSREELEGRRSWTEFYVKDDLGRMEEWHRLRRIDPIAAPRNYEARFIDKQKRIKDVFLTIALIPGTRRSVASLLDITERRRMEKELLMARKLESIGVLAGGIAHDFNNLLGVIMGYINLATMMLPPGDPVTQPLAAAERASIQAKDLTQEFIALSVGREPVKMCCSIAEIVRSQTDMVLRGSGVEARFDLPGDLWKVEIDPDQMRRAINNVIVNARDAMPMGGFIQIEARNIEVSDGGHDLGVPMKDGRYVTISVADSGTGIAAEDLHKIFDPYFSTKARGCIKGMGLGLTTAFAVINKHGGIISVDSEPGVGTVVHIHIPAGS